MTFSPAPPVAVGAALTLTATVAANAGTATPAGSVVFTVDGTVMAPVSLTAGVATAMTSFSTGGIHTVVAAYTPGTGDNFFSSVGLTTITVLATGAITTTTSVALNPSTTVAVGSSLAITATVTSKSPDRNSSRNGELFRRDKHHPLERRPGSDHTGCDWNRNGGLYRLQRSN